MIKQNLDHKIISSRFSLKLIPRSHCEEQTDYEIVLPSVDNI